MASSASGPYRDLQVVPQILRNVPLATFYLAADPALTVSLLPEGLSPAPNGRIVLNMWSHSDPRETTGFGGFGAMGIAYLAVEVAGEQGATTDGKTAFPARCWMQHWCNYEPARAYAAKTSGLTILPGQPNVTIAGDRLTGVLELGGRIVISASATVGSEPQGVQSGFSIYHAPRTGPDGAAQVARYVVPWVGDSYLAESPAVALSFDAQAPANALFGGQPPTVLGVTFRRMTLVPYLASVARQ